MDPLNALHPLLLEFLDPESDPGENFDRLLGQLLELTSSGYGFIGEVLQDAEGAPYLKTHAITNLAWDEETRAFYEENAPTGLEFRNLATLFGHTLTTGEFVVAQEPRADARSGGLPHGHPPLDAYLGVPLKNGEELIGMVGMANRPGGYSQEYVDSLSSVWTTCTALVQAQRTARERKRAEEELFQARKMESVGQLAGGLAHDMNNLLVAILGNAEIVRDTMEKAELDRAHCSEGLDQVILAGRRAASLTRQLLSFSRQQVVQPHPLRLDKTLKGLYGMLRRLIREDVQLRIECAPELWSIVADEGQINQVVMNLVVNARDAMDGGGAIQVSCRNLPDEPRRVELAVEDNGAGMDAAVQEHVFEPFFTTKPSGTGIGLATVRSIVQELDGELELDSALGRGTRVSIALPAIADARERSAPTPPTPPQHERGGETILVCEDDDAVRMIICRVLQSAGYEVLPCRNPGQAVERALEKGPDLHLLLTDVIMPGLSGPQLVDRLRSVTPELRTLYVSGYAGELLERHGVSAGEVEFLAKPFSSQSLLRAVRQALASTRV